MNLNQQEQGYPRLRELYAMLFGVPDEHFDLKDWRNIPDGKVFVENATLLEQSCGTTACAVGWACAYPSFNKQGLGWRGFPEFSGSYSWRAVENFFGLPGSVAEFLFLDDDNFRRSEDVLTSLRNDEGSLTERQAVRRRIRRLLAYKGVITPERNAELAAEEGVPA